MIESVCVCVCVRVHACVCVRACACACVWIREKAHISMWKDGTCAHDEHGKHLYLHVNNEAIEGSEGGMDGHVEFEFLQEK